MLWGDLVMLTKAPYSANPEELGHRSTPLVATTQAARLLLRNN